MGRRFRIGGREDAIALSAIGTAGLMTSPFFAGFPQEASLGIAAAGATWLGKRIFEGMAQQNLLPSKLNIESSNVLGGSEGMLIGYRTDNGKPVYIPYKALASHGLVQGGSGRGKTTLAKLMMIQQIQRGGGLFFVDAKLDSDDLDTIYQFATWCGRAQDILIINPGDANNSNTYNPILYGDPDEVADRILSLIPASEDNPGADFYRQSTKQGLTTLLGAVKAAGLAYNFADLSILITNQKALEDLDKRLRKQIPHHHATRALSLFLEQYRGGMTQGDNYSINIKRLKETFGGIGSRLHSFGTGEFGNITSSYSPQVKLYDAIMGNRIIILRLPTMGKPEASFAFAKMALADLRTAISWVQRLPVDQRPDPVFLSLFDEFGSYAMQSMAQPFEQGRSACFSLWPFFQTYGQLDKVGLEFKQIVNANTLTKIYFGVGDQIAAEEAATSIGLTNVVKEGLSNTNRESISTPKVGVSPEGGVSDDAAIGISESEEEVFRVTEDDIKGMTVGECVMTYEGSELFHLTIPNIQVSKHLAKEIGHARINYIRTKPVIGCDFFNNSDRFLTKEKTKAEKEKENEQKGSRWKKRPGPTFNEADYEQVAGGHDRNASGY